MGVPLAFIEPVADPLGDLVSRYARTHGPFTSAEAAARLGLGVAVVGTALKRLAADGRVVEGEFRPHAAPPPAPASPDAEADDGDAASGAAAGRRRPRGPVAGRRQRMVRRRSPAQAPPPLARRAACRGRARGRRRVRPLPAGLAERPRPGQARAVGAAGTGRDHHRRRPAVRRAHSGLRLGTAGPRQPGVRLPARHARRAHGCRRGALVRRGRAPRQRRLGQPAPGRFGRADPEPGHRLRARRRAAAAAGPPAQQRRRLLLPAADRRRRRHGLGAQRPGRRLRALGPRLGGPDHRRHLRPGPGDDCRRPHRAPAGRPRARGPGRPG